MLYQAFLQSNIESVGIGLLTGRKFVCVNFCQELRNEYIRIRRRTYLVISESLDLTILEFNIDHTVTEQLESISRHNIERFDRFGLRTKASLVH